MQAPVVLGLIAILFSTPLSAQDTIVVQANNPPVWGPNVELIEELRIGSLDGDAATSFGHVVALAVDEDGVIWVADSEAAEVGRFSAIGEYLGSVGRRGDGPGEFQGISGIKRLPDGRMVVWDAHGGRFTFFSSDGAFIGASSQYFAVIGALYEVFQTDTDGAMYVISARPRGQPARMRWLWFRVDQAGSILDSIPIPPSGRSVMGGRSYPFGSMRPFTPVTMTVMSPHGYLLVAQNERYAISRPLPDGRVLRIERDWEPVAVKRRERAQYESLAAHVATLWDPSLRGGNDVPRTKPPFWAFRVDEQARLWVARHSEGVHIDETLAERERRRELIQYRGSEPPPLEWWEPLVVDVIEANGRFLGTVRFPSNQAVVLAARDRHIWTVELGEFDEQYVVRYRIASPR